MPAVSRYVAFHLVLCALIWHTSALADASADLFGAARRGDVGVLQQLLAQGADADRPDTTGKTVLSLAASLGRTEIVRALLKHGVNTDSADRNGQTALMLAARGGHGKAVEALLATDPSIELADKEVEAFRIVRSTSGMVRR